MTPDLQAAAWDLRLRRFLVAGTLLGAIACCGPSLWKTGPEATLRRAASALMRDRYAEAERLANEVLQTAPRSPQALLIAGEAATRQMDDERAIAYFERVEDDGTQAAVHALVRGAERLMATGRAVQAERNLRAALAHDPGHSRANKKLAVLLQSQGRTWESAPFIRRVLLNGNVAKDNILMVGAFDTMFLQDYQFVENCLRREADNQTVLIARVRDAMVKSRLGEARSVLQRILANQPECVEAKARLGNILVDQGTDDEFLDWQANLPPMADSHPEIWYVRGLWARRNGQTKAAVRCFLEAASRDSDHKGAVFQLSQLLGDAGHPAIAEQLALRSQRLAQLNYLLMELRHGYNVELAVKAIEILELLGRPLEAAGWCEMLKHWELGHEDWAREKSIALSGQLPSGDTLTLPSENVLSRLDHNDFPLPDWSTGASGRQVKRGSAPVAGTIRFTDQAAEAGVDFDYFNGTTATVGLVHILQATGGGVGVIDYDQDGWQDLYFVQSGRFPIQSGQTEHTNRLYRNLGNGRFEDVSEVTGVNDPGYGQGIAVGDYNCDGFPDLYVANFGVNRLFENLGDGQFVEVTEQAGAGGDRWTTSCLMADLDGDALPEIYAANYALKDEVLRLKCKHEGQPRTCAPTLLTADQDQLYANLGDGRFRNVTQQSGVVATDGKGLGVVAADFENRGRLNIFVGNDTSANFYFRNETAGPGNPLAFEEQGILSGLGFDEIGKLQACMGVAAGDPDANGLLDLFVTNFYGESNVLYSQSADHNFQDTTRLANLRDCGFNMLGFGTQFLDGELDGWPDLLVTNGHIDLTFAHGDPDRMPPQYLRNLGQGEFAELAAEGLGPYFQERYFGRALAILDWNRDGRDDACISHLDAPAALLTNTTEQTGRFVAIQLRGKESNRDAIGATVTLEAGGQRWMRQLVGGDGYLVSNQRQLLFGLGSAESATNVQIRWPSGAIQAIDELAADQEWIVVEGSPPRRLARPSRPVQVLPPQQQVAQE